MTYDTEELVSIVEAACAQSIKIQSACSPLKGPGTEHPDWEEILELNTKNSLSALEGYWQLREQIHCYQRQHKISGLVSRAWTYQGCKISVFSVHDQLISVPGDKRILIHQTPDVIHWWMQVTQGMDLWHSCSSDEQEHCQVLEDEIFPLAPLAEWAEISIWHGSYPQINLWLCWGNPQPYHPESHLFYATNPLTSIEKLEQCLNT